MTAERATETKKFLRVADGVRFDLTRLADKLLHPLPKTERVVSLDNRTGEITIYVDLEEDYLRETTHL